MRNTLFDERVLKALRTCLYGQGERSSVIFQEEIILYDNSRKLRAINAKILEFFNKEMDFLVICRGLLQFIPPCELLMFCLKIYELHHA